MNTEKKTIELIVPCYNEEKCVALFYNRIKEVFSEMPEYDFAITYIDDGSKDHTMEEIKKVVVSADAGRVQYISLSRNFGKESAIYAGLSKCTGDYVALLDADLQHPPELLKEMLVAIEEEGYDCASARRVSRKGEPFIRSMFSKAFYHIINHITVIDLVPGSTDYRLMKRSVVEAIVSMTERERFTKGIYAWVGFKNKWIEYENVERAAGSTTWNFWGLVRYAYSGFIAFATTPLRGVIYFGMLIVLLAIYFAVKIYLGALHTPDAQRTGYASIMILMLFLGGVIITILGMIGEYMARIYMEVKNRPIYFARETNIGQETVDEMIKEESKP
ncbi:MAG: glycosyltransferase family 2 protein [Lachnospiraceae bacterium]|nr:glycosyltransferase family 2 protein [Tyzzerella sp.]MBQ3165595.1 glycosyltransferase family 2 protein [Lachnospiraceae bacterium]